MSELSELLDRERAAIRLDRLRPVLAEAYTAAGGSLTNVRRIVQLWADNTLTAKLATTDLPGPDALIVPKLRETVRDFVGELFDEFFAGRNLMGS